MLQDQGSTFELFINRNLAPESSEGFNQKPPYIACVNKYYNKSFAGVFKGDSVVYKFTTPYIGANINCPDPSPNSALGQGCPTEPDSFSSVSYMQGFSVLNPTNNPADTGVLRIDPQTGVISGTPNQVGNFVIGIEAMQYRNGNYLGSIKKDFMLYVLGPLPSSTNDKNTLQNSFKVFQSDGNLIIEKNNNLNTIKRLEVFNVNGSCCFNRIISSEDVRQTFDVSHFSEGIYFYRISYEGGGQASGKFVK